MHPYIITEPVVISSYSLLIFIGILLAIIILKRKTNEIPFYDSSYAVIIASVGAALGGKLFYILQNAGTIISFFRDYPLKTALEMTLSGGFVLYGGILFSIPSLYFVSKTNKVDFNLLLNTLAPSLSLAIASGRMGCLLAGCCYGRAYDGPFAIVYPEDALSSVPGGIPLFPSPIAESLICLLITAILLLREKKRGSEGAFSLFLLLYALSRFFLEFMRGDEERKSLLFFSTSQAASIAVLAFLLFVFMKKKLAKKQKNK